MMHPGFSTILKTHFASARPSPSPPLKHSTKIAFSTYIVIPRLSASFRLGVQIRLLNQEFSIGDEFAVSIEAPLLMEASAFALDPWIDETTFSLSERVRSDRMAFTISSLSPLSSFLRGEYACRSPVHTKT